ncbi:MAG: PPC domain-containing DNA-binding protein [Candidatus Flexifilum sp.]|jgi:predicted DNA-binding protein with PD1-like motif
MTTHVIRLRPGQDLKRSLIEFTQQQGLRAAFVVTCVGSLRRAALRLANREETTIFDDKFEICALVGTLDPEGCHLHIALADGTGRMIGGHLQEGSLVYTTAEIVIGVAPGLHFRREHDPETGYPELVIERIEGE